MRFLVRLVGNMVGLWLAAEWIPGVQVIEGEETWQTWAYLAVIAAILTAVGSLVRPLIKVIAFPLYILTFGLFSLITNVIVLQLAAWASRTVGVPISFDSWGATFLAATLVAIISAIIVGILGRATK
ncbi:phage holin family protein [Scrofimicrobium canadense]|nr:phage holin family protein [Scrofimicrobium canadense]